MVVCVCRQKHSFLEFIASYETPPFLDNPHPEDSKDTEQSMHSDALPCVATLLRKDPKASRRAQLDQGGPHVTGPPGIRTNATLRGDGGVRDRTGQCQRSSWDPVQTVRVGLRISKFSLMSACHKSKVKPSPIYCFYQSDLGFLSKISVVAIFMFSE